jgi:hypothetical protein
MEEKDTITIYWSTVATDSTQSWSQLYSKPINVINNLRKTKNPGSGNTSFFACPAMTDMFKNVYSFNSAIDDTVTLPELVENRNFESSEYISHFPGGSSFFELGNSGSKLSVYNHRNSSIEKHYNITYNLSWIFFADEPVVARMTSPYFPAKAPAEGVILGAGEYDIGSWFRPYNLDYHIPFGTKKLEFKENDPLFYLEIKTDKNIVFKRFIVNNELRSMHEECVQSPLRYSRFKPLSWRYKKAKDSLIPEMILKEINKNLAE